MTPEEAARRRAYQVDRTRRALTIRVPCAECGDWTSMVLLYWCFQCGFWLCGACGAHHWPQVKREPEAAAMDAESQAQIDAIRSQRSQPCPSST